MPSKSLIAAISDGFRRLPSFSAQLQTWPLSLTDPGSWSQVFAGASFTGKSVSVDQALRLSTVWSCVRLISETLATLPIGFYQRESDGSRTPATRHALYEILHNQPNADQTAVVFWEVVVASLLLWGNAYIEIVRGGGSIISLLFLHPARVTWKKLKNGAYEYSYSDGSSGTPRPIAEANMMHIPAFSVDGKTGLSPIAYGANVMGTSIETDRASSETFGNAMRSPGIITMNQFMNPEQRAMLRAHIQKVQAEGGIMIVETGQKFEPLTFKPADAELLASRSWNVEEMCRWFRIDPAMVGHGGKDSNWGTGLEQKMIWFLTFTLRHWCVRIEQSIRKNLLTPMERMKYFAEFAIEGLLRADSATRAAWYGTMTQNGIMTRDQVRKLENWPAKGGNADVLTVQSNMMPLDKLGMNMTPPPAPAPRDEDKEKREAQDDLLKAALTRPAPAITVSPPNVNVTVTRSGTKHTEVTERDANGFAKKYTTEEE